MFFSKDAGATQVVNPSQVVSPLKIYETLKQSKFVQEVMTVLPSLETYFD